MMMRVMETPALTDEHRPGSGIRCWERSHDAPWPRCFRERTDFAECAASLGLLFICFRGGRPMSQGSMVRLR